VLFINAVCDIVGCKTAMPCYFEHPAETFDDLVKAIQSQGWIVGETNPAPGVPFKQVDLRLYCPKHKPTPVPMG